MIQQVLSCCESLDSDLSVFLDSSQNSYYVYLGVSLLEKVGISPELLSHKMLVGRLYNAGAKLCVLKNTFHHEPRTIKKWGAALLSEDPESMAKAFSGRSGNRKICDSLIRYVMQLFRNRSALGRSYRAKIIELTKEVFNISISKTRVSQIFRLARDEDKAEQSGSNTGKGGACEASQADTYPDINTAQNRSVSEHSDTTSSSNEAITVQQSTCFPVMTYNMQTASGRMVQNAGLILFGSALKGYGPFQAQMLCQLLQGALNIERSKSLCFDSMRYFVEKVEPVLKNQRTMLDLAANPGNTLELYRKNAQLLQDGPGKGMVYYFDPHTKEYTGQLKVLKGWCGSAHSISKVINLDSFHTRSGRPCFIQHYSPYYDMRERFFMSLKLFDQLFPEDQRSGRTFIIDRAIFGEASFMNFTHDYLITWEKGYKKDGWDDNKEVISFTRHKKKNSKKSKRYYSFECQEYKWDKNDKFRRIIAKATNWKGTTIQVSILCSNPHMSVEEAVWLICNRWLQENDFKYLGEYFGINQLDSRKHDNFAEIADLFTDREVDSAEYKQLKTLVNAANKALATHLLKVHKTEKQLAGLYIQREKVAADNTKELRSVSGKIQRREEKLDALNLQLHSLESNLETAECRQTAALQKVSRIETLLCGSYKMIDTRRKAYMDALRINASNIFRNLHQKYREIYDDYRDDHYYLRLLTRVNGYFCSSEGLLNVKLWVPGTLQPRTLEGLNQLAKLTAEELNAPMAEQQRKIHIELISGPICPATL